MSAGDGGVSMTPDGLHASRAPAPEHRAQLRERAAALARVAGRSADADARLSLRFSLGGQAFVIAASCILQVAVLRELAPLPGAPAPLFGITNWRGRVLTVLDLRERLGVATGGLTDLSRLVIVDDDLHPFAFLADSVVEMLPVSEAALHPLPDRTTMDGSLLRGMTADGAFVVDDAALRRVFTAATTAAHTTARGG